MSYLGEVLLTNTTEFNAQAVNVNESPDFGNFVKVLNKEETIFGVVYQISTGSIDNSRKPMAFGKSEVDLLREQPQLLHLLKTDFSCITIGHQKAELQEKRKYLGYLPGRPPKIHSFVESCNQQEIKVITDDLKYIQFLLAFNGSFTDQLLSACIRQGYLANQQSKDFLVKTGKYLLPLLRHDLDRFNLIFRSVR